MDNKIEISCIFNSIDSSRVSSKVFEIASPNKYRSIANFHQSLPGYQATPLSRLPKLAKHLGISDLWVKNESFRFDLNAFKVLGASYAIAKILAEMVHLDIEPLTFEKLAINSENFQDLVLVTATDGNHGRAVAWTANQLGCKATVYMPKGSSETRLKAILNLGAQVSIIDGNYDDTVRLAVTKSEENGWILIQDTSWPGYEDIPTYIMQGYFTILSEIVQQFHEDEWPTHVFVQAGVGSLAGAVQAFLCNYDHKPKPFFIVVEPANAACLYKSMAISDGKPHAIQGDLDTVMAGLACGKPSHLAWKILERYAYGFIACTDQIALRGMRILGNTIEDDDRVVSGESGAVTTGLVYELLSNCDFAGLRKDLMLNSDSSVLLISTEGDTDPVFYRETVW